MLELPDNIRRSIQEAPFARVPDLWRHIEEEFGDDGQRWLGLNDRFYLLVRILKRLDVVHPWLYARCREVENDTDGYLDLWAREHYKSTIITYAGVIQEILRDPDITVGIFSHTKPISKAFLKQIKTEFETNEFLKTLYPDILYANPEKDSPGWSIDSGIIVKRKSNPKECTIEAHGLTDGMPTSRHFKLLVYDDVVTDSSVNTPEQIQKTTTAWELSDNLGASNAGIVRKWHIGTRYSYADTYQEMMNRGSVVPRLYPATDNGQIDGEPVFLKKEVWLQKVRDQGDETISCQMLQNPLAGKQRMFNVDDLQEYELRPETMNVYILVDPARSKKRDSAKTAVVVLGLDYAMNKYLLDGFNHRMDLRERWERTAQMYHKWKRAPGVQNTYVGYESFGAQADMDYFEEQMKRPDQGGRFPILELQWPREGEGSKVDRVQRIGPDLRGHRIYMPYPTNPDRLTTNQRKFMNTGQGYRVSQIIKRKDENDAIYDLSAQFKLQIHFFPFGSFKDLADAFSRLYDMEPKPPRLNEATYYEPEFT